MTIHSTHKTRVSFDASSYDEIWTKCKALEQSCPAEEEIITTATPYGEVSGPASAIKYVNELIDDDTRPILGFRS